MEKELKCKCGFKFAGAGEFRNCDAFITNRGESGIVCPKCGAKYIGGRLWNEPTSDNIITTSDNVEEL